MPTWWAKNGTVLFNCLNIVTLLLLLTSVSHHLHTVLSTFFINKNVEKIKKTLINVKNVTKIKNAKNVFFHLRYML